MNFEDVRGLVYATKQIGGKNLIRMSLADSTKTLQILERGGYFKSSKNFLVRTFVKLFFKEGSVFFMSNHTAHEFVKLEEKDAIEVLDLLFYGQDLDRPRIYSQGHDVYYEMHPKDVLLIEFSKENCHLGKWGDKFAEYNTSWVL